MKSQHLGADAALLRTQLRFRFLSVTPRGCWQREVEVGGWEVSPWTRGSGWDNSTWLEITIRRQKHTKVKVGWGGLAQDPAAQTKVTKYQWVKVKVTDRQHICIRQDPIVEETQKSSDRPGWPAPFVTHSQRPEETDRYTWISATRSCSLTHKLHCPFHLRHPVPCQLFISPPASLAPMPSPLGQWSIRSLRTESTQTYGGWLDILNQTINTTSAPVAVSFHSHQINQSGWTCPLNSQLVNSSVMS